MTAKYWTEQTIRTALATCSSKSDFTKKFASAYVTANKLGIWETLCHKKGWPIRVSWNYEKAAAAAANYDRPSDFKKAHSAGYRWASKNGVLQEITAHMDREKSRKEASARMRETKIRQFEELGPKYTVDDVIASASKFNRPIEWKSAEPTMYRWGARLECIADATAHMTEKLKTWSSAAIWNEVSKYTTKKEFREKSPSAYNTAIAKGIIDDVNSTLTSDWQHVDWTPEKVIESAKQFTQRIDWYLAVPGGRKAAKRFGIEDEATAHMSWYSSGFDPDKPAQLYYLRIAAPDDEILYKIGITTHKDLNRRFGGDMARITKLKSWHFSTAREAKNLENEILAAHIAHQYSGPKFMTAAGETEMFTKDVLGLDKLSEHQ